MARIVLALIIIGLSVATAYGEPEGCAHVRAYVAQVGTDQARSNAIAYGMTPQQEALARSCLAGKKKAQK